MRSKPRKDHLWVHEDFKMQIKVAAVKNKMSILKYTEMLSKDLQVDPKGIIKKDDKKKYQFRI